VVTIDFKPSPDSRNRLRRLYTLLLEHATDGQPAGDESRQQCVQAVDACAAE